LGLTLSPDGAFVRSLVESSEHLSTSPASEPLALSPHSLASSEGSTSLSLSHPDSDSSSLGGRSSSGDTSGEGSSSSSVLGADSVLDSPSSQDTGSSEVESSFGDTSGEGTSSSSVSSARSVSSGPSFENSHASASGSTSSPSRSASSVGGTGGSRLVLESPDDLLSSWGTDLSHDSLSRSPDGAVKVASSESTNDSGVLHLSSPGASLKGEGSFSEELALLKTSFELSDDSRSTCNGGSFDLSASGESSSSKLANSAAVGTPSESFDDSSFLWNLEFGLRLTSGGSRSSSLVRLANELSTFESLHKFSHVSGFSIAEQRAAQHAH